MSNHDTPEPYETLELQSIVDGELARVDMEDKHGRIDLKGKVLLCIARLGERIIENAEVQECTLCSHVEADAGMVMSGADFDELEGLLDDLKTIEQEGW